MPSEVSTSERELPRATQPVAPPSTEGTEAPSPSAPSENLAHASTMAPTPATQEPSANETPDTDDPLIGTVIADRYRLLRRVGEGGMGAVYEGEHVGLRKRVAVKFLHAELSRIPDVVARFEREAIAAANLDHPNVVAAHDFGKTADGQFYLVLDFVEGGSLRDLLDTEKRLPPARALHIARHIAAALHRAHSVGIVHRDLKPENVVLVEREGDRDFAKVIDFGIAKIAPGKLGEKGSALTQAGMVFGTPEYMAPEQALGAKIDHRADLYSFGVMVFEMLVGQRPFTDDDVMTLLGKHMTAPPPLASTLVPPGTLPPSVDSVLARMLAKSPSERYGSALEFVQALGDALGIPVSAAGTVPPGLLAPLGNAFTPAHGVPAAVPAAITGMANTAVAAPGRPTTMALVSGGIRQVFSTLVTGYAALRQDPRRHRRVLAGMGILAVLSVLLGIVTGPKSSSSVRTSVGTGSAPVVHAERHGAVTTVRSGSASSAHAAPASESVPLRRSEPVTRSSEAPSTLAARLEEYRSRPDVAVLLDVAHGRRLHNVITVFEQRRSQTPGDPFLNYLLGTLYARDRRRMNIALDRYAEALRLEPGFAFDRTLVRDVVRAYVESRHPPAQAETLLRGPLAATAGDVLLEVAIDGRKASARTRALALLATPTFARDYDGTARALVELSEARTCEAKRTVVERLGQIGDARALPYLRRIRVGRGCGFLGMGECNPCLADVLPAAIAAIERRVRSQQR